MMGSCLGCWLVGTDDGFMFGMLVGRVSMNSLTGKQEKFTVYLWQNCLCLHGESHLLVCTN